MRQPISVYIGGRDERDLYGLDRLAGLAAQHGHMTVTPVLSAPSAPTDRRTGFLHTVVRADLEALDGWKCYTAGPPAMIDALTEVVLARGLQRDHLHADVFFTPTTAPRSVEIAAAEWNVGKAECREAVSSRHSALFHLCGVVGGTL